MENYKWYAKLAGENDWRYLTDDEVNALYKGYPRGAAIVTNGWEYGQDNTGKTPTISTGNFQYGAD